MTHTLIHTKYLSTESFVYREEDFFMFQIGAFIIMTPHGVVHLGPIGMVKLSRNLKDVFQLRLNIAKH